MEALLIEPMALLLALAAFMSLVLFAAMGLDKAKARRGSRRISEKSLFILAVLGGAPGGWLGMYVFRHKTKHLKFVLGFPAICLLQAALYAYFLLK